MTIIHRRENTRVKSVEGGAIYLSPQYHGNGFPNIGNITRNVSSLFNKGVRFANDNKDLIKTGIEAGTNVVNTINNIRQTANEVEKVKQLRELNKKLDEAKSKKKKKKDEEELTEEQKKIIEETIKGSGLKRF